MYHVYLNITELGKVLKRKVKERLQSWSLEPKKAALGKCDKE